MSASRLMRRPEPPVVPADLLSISDDPTRARLAIDMAVAYREALRVAIDRSAHDHKAITRLRAINGSLRDEIRRLRAASCSTEAA